jgi:hypothetical protein
VGPKPIDNYNMMRVVPNHSSSHGSSCIFAFVLLLVAPIIDGLLYTSCRQHTLSSSSLFYHYHHHPTKLYGSNTHGISDDEQLKQTLHRYGFGNRLVTLENDELLQCPMIAEMYEQGRWKVCLIIGLKSPSQNDKPPLLNVLAMNADGLLQDEKVIDIGEW